MNPIQLSVIILLLLANVCRATAKDQPSKAELKKFALLFQSGLALPKSDTKQGYCKKVSIYFSVNEKGEVEQVSAIVYDKELKQSLESRFRNIHLKGFPPHQLSRVEIQYRVY